MAMSGLIQGSTTQNPGGNPRSFIRWYGTRDTAAIVGNYTNVTLEVLVDTTSTGWTWNGTVSGAYDSIDGNRDPSSGSKANFNSNNTGGWTYSAANSPTGRAAHRIWQRTRRIQHNNDGTKSLNLSAYFQLPSGGYGPGTCSISGTIILDTIPRGSIFGTIPDFTFDGNANVGAAFNVPVTKYVSTYTDKLIIKIGSTIVATRDSFVSGNVTFSSDELTSIYNIMTATNKTEFTFEISTYNGTAQIGSTATKKANGEISSTGRSPTLDSAQVAYEDSNVTTFAITGNRQKIIKGYSDLKILVNQKATANKGATLGNNAYKFDTTGRTSQYANHSATLPLTITFTKQEQNQFTVSIVDSRTNQLTIPKTVDLIDYSKPAISDFKITRATDTTAAMLFNGTFKTFTGLSQQNTILTARYRYRVKGVSSWGAYTNITLTTNTGGNYARTSFNLTQTFDANTVYEFELEIKDRLETVPFYGELDSAIHTMHLDVAERKVSIGQPIPSTQIIDSINSKNGFFENGTKIGGFNFKIGDMWLTTVNENPQTRFGGTWVIWSVGQAVVGVDTSQAEFNTSEKTGGAKVHTLTLTEIASHSHTVNNHSHGQNTIGNDGNVNPWVSAVNSGAHGVRTQQQAAYHSGTGTQVYTQGSAPGTNAQGGGAAHNNLQPYKTCYVWKKTT